MGSQVAYITNAPIRLLIVLRNSWYKKGLLRFFTKILQQRLVKLGLVNQINQISNF